MSLSERALRVGAGVFLLVLAFALPTSWGWLGIYPLLTGLMGTMPDFKMPRIGRHG